MSEAKDYQAKWKQLDDQYQSGLITLHKDIQDYILPRRGNFVERGKPYDPASVHRADLIINDCATRANRICGSGMYGGLCSNRWFEFDLEDEDLAEWGPVKDWLKMAEEIEYKTLANSNFYQVIHNHFEEQAGFGTHVILREKHFADIVRFTGFTTGEYRLALGPDGDIDTCYRQFWLTAKNIVKLFGKGKVSNAIKQASEKPGSKFEYFEIIQAIEPNTSRDTTKTDNLNMAYRSVWFEGQSAGDEILRKSGYVERPFQAGRWSDVGNMAYGLGPGHDCLGQVKMLQEMEKDTIKASHKSVDPPLDVPSRYKDIISQLPGAQNYSYGEGTGDRIKSIYDVNFNINDTEQKIQQIESRIERDYFNDIFTMIINSESSGRQVTATEIMERKHEKISLLGPVVGREIKEVLKPIVEGTFNDIYAVGGFPQPPDELMEYGATLKVKFVSVLAQAQRLLEAQSLEAYSIQAERVAALDEMTLQKTNWAEYLDKYADIVGVPGGIIRSDEEYEQIVAQIQQQRQQEAEMMRLQAGVQSMKDLGQANTGDGSALGDIVNGAQQ